MRSNRLRVLYNRRGGKGSTSSRNGERLGHGHSGGQYVGDLDQRPLGSTRVAAHGLWTVTRRGSSESEPLKQAGCYKAYSRWVQLSTLEIPTPSQRVRHFSARPTENTQDREARKHRIKYLILAVCSIVFSSGYSLKHRR